MRHGASSRARINIRATPCSTAQPAICAQRRQNRAQERCQPLGRYLYRGVIQERDIIACANGQVTYRWRDSKSKQMTTRSVSGAEFLRLLMQHVLPKGFRRARNFGFLHPNSKRLIALLRLLVFKQAGAAPAAPCPRPQWLCGCCGAPMLIVRRRILAPATLAPSTRAPQPGAQPREQHHAQGAMA